MKQTRDNDKRLLYTLFLRPLFFSVSDLTCGSLILPHGYYITLKLGVLKREDAVI